MVDLFLTGGLDAQNRLSVAETICATIGWTAKRARMALRQVPAAILVQHPAYEADALAERLEPLGVCLVRFGAEDA